MIYDLRFTMVSLGRAFHFSLSRFLTFPLSRLLVFSLTLLLTASSTHAADSYFGAKPIVTTLHPTTNYLIAVLGNGSNAVVRIINPEELLTLMKSLTNWNAQTASQVLSNLAANAGTTATNSAPTQFTIVNGTLWAIPGIALTNLAARSSAIDKVALTLAGAAGQDSNLIEVNDALGNRLWGIGYDGTMIGAAGESPRLASSSTAGYVWTATDTIGNGSFQALTGGGDVTTAQLIATNNAILATELTRNAAVSNAAVAFSMTVSNAMALLELTRNAAVSNACITFGMTVSNDVYTAETTRNAAVSNACVQFGMTVSNAVYSLETTRNAAVSNAAISFSMTVSNDLAATELTRNAAVSNAAIAFSMTVSNACAVLSSNQVRIAAGSSIAVTASGAAGVMTYTIDITALTTNVTSLSISNAISKPILHGVVNRTANLMGLEAGANVTLSPNGSNLVIAASGGAASTNNPVDASGYVVPTNGVIQLQLPLVQGGTNLWAFPGSAGYSASWSNNIAANAGGLTNVMLSNMVVGVTVDIWLTITPGVTVQFPQFSSSQWITGMIPRFATNSSTVHVQAINRGGGITNLWVVQNDLVLIKGTRVTFTTNFSTGEVTVDVDSTLSAIGSAPVTNELSSALQINSGVLSLSAGVLSNLVQSLVDFPAANIISNVSAIALGTAWQKVAPTNNVTVTNLSGLVHASSASVIVIDANQSHEWTITNRITAATTLVFTNGADGQTINVNLLGEVSGGTSRVISLVPHTGTLIADEDDFSVAPATSSSFTLTNGNGAEISWRLRRLNGTNIAGKVTRQFKF